MTAVLLQQVSFIPTMGCNCKTCGKLARRKLKGLPYNEHRWKVILYVCRHVANAIRDCKSEVKIAATNPEYFGLPSTDPPCLHDGSVLLSTVMAVALYTSNACAFSANDVTYHFTWKPKLAELLAKHMARLIVKVPRSSGVATDVIRCDERIRMAFAPSAPKPKSNHECVLTRSIVENPRNIVLGFPFLSDYEPGVKPGSSVKGHENLVFTDGKDYLVLTVNAIGASGREIHEQACRRGAQVASRVTGYVFVATCTQEGRFELMQVFIPDDGKPAKPVKSIKTTNAASATITATSANRRDQGSQTIGSGAIKARWTKTCATQTQEICSTATNDAVIYIGDSSEEQALLPGRTTQNSRGWRRVRVVLMLIWAPLLILLLVVVGRLVFISLRREFATVVGFFGGV
ncbi:hypothetical protein SeLEV6574_g04427 [Synchytrium endobioticum]|uniref:Uncharacterized protein n=1 Tax=Synchytrium endobioticum TaxID=286115 RepID=A0A507CZS9_9FUNG|nr:hypothetical protein SeLEV6574_g04427 [Synchytrium endobioticum]